MQEEAILTEGPAPLSQVARTIDTFIAPSKTFTDILRSANCWLPLVLTMVLSLGWTYSIDKTVGFAAVTEQQVAKSTRQAEAMQSMPPEDRAHSLGRMTSITRGVSYASFIFIFVFMAIEALILWASFNFGLGAETTFPRVFAVVAFAGLPRTMLTVISAILLFAGVGTENFNMRNPVGTNLGYYLTDSPQWMQTAGTFFDILGFWTLALMVLGMAIISRKTIAQSATVVMGWWALILLVFVGFSAAFS